MTCHHITINFLILLRKRAGAVRSGHGMVQLTGNPPHPVHYSQLVTQAMKLFETELTFSHSNLNIHL